MPSGQRNDCDVDRIAGDGLDSESAKQINKMVRAPGPVGPYSAVLSRFPYSLAEPLGQP
jgi:hypothetical protein